MLINCDLAFGYGKIHTFYFDLYKRNIFLSKISNIVLIYNHFICTVV